MDKLELINLISRTGIEYHEDDFNSKIDVIWLYFIDTKMFTEDELTLVTHLNGYNEKTLNDILFIRYGYRDLPQYLESEVLFENGINVGTVVKILQKDAPYNSYGKTGTVVDVDYEETDTWYQVQFDKPNPETPYETWVREQDLQVLNESTLNENKTLNEAKTGFTIAYPNGDFYIGKPMDLYALMTDFLVDWDEDKTTMTEYEAENVASIRENYEEVFYAALEGGNYWEAEEFEEAFGRFSNYGIANALSINENKTLTEDVVILDTVVWDGNSLEDWARNEGWNLDHLIDLLEPEDWVWQELFDIIDGRTLTKTELNDFLRFDAEDIALEILGKN